MRKVTLTPPQAVPPFALSLESNDAATRKALAQLLNGLEPLGLEPEECSTVELVLAEVLNNIVEHAYPDPDRPGPIHIHCSHARDGLHLIIRDQGLPMPGGQPPLGLAQSVTVAVDDLPEGGFGWFLVRDLARDLSYRRTAGVNQLEVRLAVGLPG